MKLPSCAVWLLLAFPAFAGETEILSHRGALGVQVGGGGEFVSSSFAVGDQGFRTLTEVVGTLGIGDRFGVRVGARFSPWPGSPTGAGLIGLNTNYGYDHLKTFFDLDFLVHGVTVRDAEGNPAPARFSFGPHLVFGGQYDFTELVGAYAAIGATFGFGAGLRLQFEMMVGVHLRTYLFQ